MKTINSKDLFYFINDLPIGRKANFKVYCGNSYLTDIHWDGDDFCWESGKFSSGAFFNTDYWFEIIEEDKKIEKLNLEHMSIYEMFLKVQELIDEVNKLKNKE